MRAMVLDRARTPLRPAEFPDPEPAKGEILLRVRACGVCRTDLHIVDGDLTEPKLPLVPGHQIVGEVLRARSIRRTGHLRVVMGEGTAPNLEPGDVVVLADGREAIVRLVSRRSRDRSRRSSRSSWSDES
jgi:D-arabinose 1-dehydrogenase-like Zn-dependent alcohol dehydrogenase